MLNIKFVDKLLEQLDNELIETTLKPLVEQNFTQISESTFVAEDDAFIILGTFEINGDDTHLTIQRVSSKVNQGDFRDYDQIKDLPDSELSFMEKKMIESKK